MVLKTTGPGSATFEDKGSPSWNDHEYEFAHVERFVKVTDPPTGILS